MENVVHREEIPARIGLLGNPSDGFFGKTLSFLIRNFKASVIAEVSSSQDNTSFRRFEIVPHPEFDSNVFDGIEGLYERLSVEGYYGGIRLVRAACLVFFKKCSETKILFTKIQEYGKDKNIKLSYDTNIPRMVGLSGSSAIVMATFRVLMKLYGVLLSDLHITKEEFPQVILDIEKSELSISAGLQDRVVQAYGGLVFMDFTGLEKGESVGKYMQLDCSLLPKLYLLYDTRVGGESGTVHSTVKQRWADRDPELVAGMAEIASLAQAARDLLLATENDDKTIPHGSSSRTSRLATLLERNFALRRRLYGDSVVGQRNIMVSELAAANGLAVKFTGSGGAFVCLRKPHTTDDAADEWFDEGEENRIREKFRAVNFDFVRIMT